MGKRYAARTWSWKAGVPGGSTCGATTRPAPARVEPVAAREKTAIARRRRTCEQGYGPPLRPDRVRERFRRSGLERALAADPDDGRMREVGAEPLLRAQAPAERLERSQRDLLLRAAATADEVAMSLDVRAMP